MTRTERESDDGKKESYGPLTTVEWLDLDHWAFQELPRETYSLFERLLAYHQVPIREWLRDRHVSE